MTPDKKPPPPEALDSRARFALEAVGGWLLLGNAAEARLELEALSPTQRTRPEALLAEWEIHAFTKDWPAAVRVAQAVTRIQPEGSAGYVKKAYALHELQRTQEAWDCLHPVSSRFFEEWIIPYNLACYACQLGRHTEALKWLRRAFRLGGAKEMRALALEDADLADLHENIIHLDISDS